MSALGLPVRPWPRMALVVFSGEAHLWWLRRLKPGFRHCFAVLRFADRWVVVNPMAHQTEIAVYGDHACAEIAQAYRARGMTVVACRVCPAQRRPAPWRPFTCVEAVKRLLGLRAPAIFTPWQLYRRIDLKLRKKTLTEP